MKLLANFTMEVDGTLYQPGDPIGDIDQGTTDYLVLTGKATLLEDADPELTAIGDEGADEKPKPAKK